jgi:hypothetical protein
MRAWIAAKDVPTYMTLMREEGADPQVVEQQESKSLVVMTTSVAQLWATSDYWYEVQE